MVFKKVRTKPTKFLYKIGYSIEFSSNVSYSRFVITSREIKKTVSTVTKKAVYYHIYGIKLDESLYGENLDKRFNHNKPSPNDKELTCFATYGDGSCKFVAKESNYATLLLLNHLKNDKSI